jgi:hypothetical protein
MKRKDLKPGDRFMYSNYSLEGTKYIVPPVGCTLNLPDPEPDWSWSDGSLMPYDDVTLLDRDSEGDVVNSPPHYARLKPQPIEVMAAWNLPCFPSMAIKYVARAGFKAGVDATVDYRKAISYLEREIARLQGKSVVKDVPNS